MSTISYSIKAGDFDSGGSASRALKEQLKRIGADPAIVRRAMIAAYEAEMNVVIHSYGGELRAVLDNGLLEVVIEDRGPGIADIEQALRPGFSTASAYARELGFGAGMGLPNIKKNSDDFSITSAPGQGTRVGFSLRLKTSTLYGTGPHSLKVVAENCVGCLRCLHVCPTRALRVFRGKPEILDYLCIDCTACLAACPTGALAMTGGNESLTIRPGTTLLIPPEFTTQFGAGVTAQTVISELGHLGFTEVRTTQPWEAALRQAVSEYAQTKASTRPVISPACPAVLNLIQTRFPSLLPHVAPYLPALEAAMAESKEPATVVVLCPAQRTLLSSDRTHPSLNIITPATLRAVVLPQLVGKRSDPTASTSEQPAPSAEADVLRVTGLTHIHNVLENIENGLANDITNVELWACDAGCLGSPLLTEDPFLANHRWSQAPLPLVEQREAKGRSAALAPRAGLRLDEQMTKAIIKLARINTIIKTLPGINCSLCGAPTCAALAEDIVLGRVAIDACMRRPPEAQSPDGHGLISQSSPTKEKTP